MLCNPIRRNRWKVSAERQNSARAAGPRPPQSSGRWNTLRLWKTRRRAAVGWSDSFVKSFIFHHRSFHPPSSVASDLAPAAQRGPACCWWPRSLSSVSIAPAPVAQQGPRCCLSQRFSFAPTALESAVWLSDSDSAHETRAAPTHVPVDEFLVLLVGRAGLGGQPPRGAPAEQVVCDASTL